MRIAVYTLLGIAAANTAIIAWGRTSFVPLGFFAIAAVLFAATLLALAAVIYAFSRRAMNDVARLTLRILISSSIVFASAVVAVPVARHLIAQDLRAAMASARALVPLLDARLVSTGLYPTSLVDIAGSRPLPPMLRRPDAYTTSGTGFVIQIRIPGTVYAASVFHSGEREWKLVE